MIILIKYYTLVVKCLCYNQNMGYENLEKLIDVVRTLRSPEGCQWDRAQTHKSLKPNMLEEAYEAVVATPSNTQPATSQNNTTNSNNTTNASSNNNPTMVTESVSESVTPNSVSYEVDEMED